MSPHTTWFDFLPGYHAPIATTDTLNNYTNDAGGDCYQLVCKLLRCFYH